MIGSAQKGAGSNGKSSVDAAAKVSFFVGLGLAPIHSWYAECTL
jgi:hypothetical protein